jgi:hypothetical protein
LLDGSVFLSAGGSLLLSAMVLGEVDANALGVAVAFECADGCGCRFDLEIVDAVGGLRAGLRRQPMKEVAPPNI